MMKKIYSCDICRETKERNNLIGVYFTSNSCFKLTESNRTDGIHMCMRCLRNLKVELDSVDIDVLVK